VDDDSVVITDFDYEDYIARMGRFGFMVPRGIGDLMNDRRFLFMGYSLSDWNIRTILTSLMRRRSEGSGRDRAVMKELSASARAYCERRNIEVVQTSLDEFASGISEQVGNRDMNGGS
jgi:hypothetical protein